MILALANIDVALAFTAVLVIVLAVCERMMRPDAVTEVRDHPDNRARRALCNRCPNRATHRAVVDLNRRQMEWQQ